MRRIGVRQPTHVYKEPFTNAKPLKSYLNGSVLKFSSYGNGWYKTGVLINGKKQECYIKAIDVELAVSTAEQELVSNVFALKNPTNVYQNANVSSNVLKTYPKSRTLTVRTFSENWYQARVKVNDSYVLGYIKKEDLGRKITNYKYSKYNISLNDAINIQMNISPKTSLPKTSYSEMYVHKNALSKVNNKWIINGNDWNVRSSPNTSSSILGSIGKDSVNDPITVYGTYGDFYKFHTWIVANKKAVEDKLNPNKFHKGSNAYYQFLDLSTSANINTDEVNNKILKGKGILDGKAKAFNEAAKLYNVNELYLISHAILETGNGTSGLANGDFYKGIKVYNMYGVGAADSCASPYECGLKHAYEKKWFTPEAAIIGGAEFIANKYISKGQNTLYKMR